MTGPDERTDDATPALVSILTRPSTVVAAQVLGMGASASRFGLPAVIASRQPVEIYEPRVMGEGALRAHPAHIEGETR